MEKIFPPSNRGPAPVRVLGLVTTPPRWTTVEGEIRTIESDDKQKRPQKRGRSPVGRNDNLEKNSLV